MPKKAKAGRGGRGAGSARRGGGGGRARDDRSGYQNRIRARKLEEAEKSKARGCPLTLMVMAMPFVLIGASFWLLFG